MQELIKRNVDTVLARFCVKYNYNHPEVVETRTQFIICFNGQPGQKFSGEKILKKMLEEEFGKPVYYDSYKHPVVTNNWTYIHFYIKK